MAIVECRLKGIKNKLPDILRIDPGGSQPHIDLRRIQPGRLGLLQGFHIGPEDLTGLQCFLSLLQFFSHIAGQIFVGGHILRPFFFRRSIGQTENHPLQLAYQLLFAFPGELLHIDHVHTGFFRNGYSQSFAGCVYGSHHLMGLDGALRKHICLALQLPILIDDFQCTQEIIGRIIGKGCSVFPVIDETMLGRKKIVQPI